MIRLLCFLWALILPTVLISQELEPKELPKDSIRIKDNFGVVYSSTTILSSVDWNSFLECYNMRLTCNVLSPFITIKFITRKPFYPGIGPLVEKLPQMKKTLYESYPYKYASNHDSVNLELHFIKKSPLSKYAKKALRKDLRKTGLKKKLPDLRNALLVFTDEGNTWHTWIILENGNSLLWYYQGDKVLGLDKNLLKSALMYTFSYSFELFDSDGKIIIEK